MSHMNFRAYGGNRVAIVLGLGSPSLASVFHTSPHSSPVLSFFLHLTGKVYKSVKAHLQESCAGIERSEVLMEDLMIVRRCWREESSLWLYSLWRLLAKRFTLVVKTLLVHVEPYISAHTLYLHTCPNTSSIITFYYWDYYTIKKRRNS